MHAMAMALKAGGKTDAAAILRGQGRTDRATGLGEPMSAHLVACLARYDRAGSSDAGMGRRRCWRTLKGSRSAKAQSYASRTLAVRSGV